MHKIYSLESELDLDDCQPFNLVWLSLLAAVYSLLETMYMWSIKLNSKPAVSFNKLQNRGSVTETDEPEQKKQRPDQN